MYLPSSVRLAAPFIATWRGKSGKVYEFAVTDADYHLRDGPAVVILAEQRPGGSVVPLWIGSNAWSAARGWYVPADSMRIDQPVQGIRRLHVRFEAMWARTRESEIEDLMTAFEPSMRPWAPTEMPDSMEVRPDQVSPSSTASTPVAGAGEDVPASDNQSEKAAEKAVSTRQVEWAWRRPSMWSRLEATLRNWLRGTRPVAPSIAISNRDIAPEAGTAPRGEVVGAEASSSASYAVGKNVSEGEVNDERSEENGPAAADVSSKHSEEERRSESATSKARRDIGLPDHGAIVLFAGEMSYDAGVDILVDALAIVARDPTDAMFVFVGDGPIKSDMQDRATYAGLAENCRFVGHLTSEAFASVLDAADIVVIPARCPQDSALAQRAVAAGHWVLATHQARVDGIEHGRNGLLAYDNPGSLIWGLRELLSKVPSAQARMAGRAAA